MTYTCAQSVARDDSAMWAIPALERGTDMMLSTSSKGAAKQHTNGLNTTYMTDTKRSVVGSGPMRWLGKS